MKLAIVVEHFDGGRGGGGDLAGWVAAEMVRRGHEVHVLCHDSAARVSRFRQATQRASFDAHRSRRAHGGPGPEANQEMRDPLASQAMTGPGELHVHRLEGMRLNSALGFRVFGARARAWCRRHGPDVVHSFTVACPGDVYHAHGGLYSAMEAQGAAMRSRETRWDWKRLAHQLPGKRRTLLTLERRAMEKAARIVSLSVSMTEQIGAFFGEAAGRKAVTLAVPTLRAEGTTCSAEEMAALRAWFRGHYGIGAGRRVALFVGHDFRRKGLRHAIEAVARTTDWNLIVVGLGRVRPFVELAEALGLGPRRDAEDAGGERGHAARVLFIGPTREMDAVYAAADALLLPAFYEPSNVVVLEALAQGLPVVSTAFLGAAEAIREGRVGAIVDDPRDEGALAAALNALPAAGSAEREALARRARSAAAGFSPADFADRLEALYRDAGRR